MLPHSATGSCIARFALGTFSITQGRPVAMSSGRVGVIRSILCFLISNAFPNSVKNLHGGDAWM